MGSFVRAAVLAAAAAGTVLSAPVSAGFLTGRTDADIRAMLARVPASTWTAELGGFNAVDFAALREGLGVSWPDTWPSDRDSAGHDEVVQVFVQLPLIPWPLVAVMRSFESDPLAEIGASTLRIDGTIESGMFSVPHELSVIVGDGVADGASIDAALGSVGTDRDGLRLWNVAAGAVPYALRDAHLFGDLPDLLAFQGTDQDAGQLIGVLRGDGSSLADLAPVQTMLAAVDGDGRSEGRLAAAWAGHPDALRGFPAYPADGWPAEATLPPYRLFGAALRIEGGMAVGLFVLAYDDPATAARGLAEMTRRAPEIADRMRAEAPVVTQVDAASGSAVVIETRVPLADTIATAPRGPYHFWTKLLLTFADVRLITP